MMKKKTENRNKVIRQLTVLPLLVILILGLSIKEFKAAPDVRQIQNFSEVNLANEDLIAGDSVKKVKKDIVVVGYQVSKSSADTVKTRIKSSGSNTCTITNADGQKSTYTAKGKTEKSDNDVIQVIGYGMKKEGENFSGDSIKIRTSGNNQSIEPIYILDGKEINSLDGVSPDAIESISVLKNESSVALYGEKGKNGVIIITSKKVGQPTDNVLIILDGVATKKKVTDINPNDIQSVNVLKGDQAIAKYGEKGKNGVVEITIKKGTETISTVISTVDQLRKQIAATIRYPKAAIENGEQSMVYIYAFVNDQGAITQITSAQPASDFVRVDEVVVVGYVPQSITLQQVENSSSMVQESALQIKKLPDLAIEQLKNRWVVFQFNFRLEKH